MLNELRGLHQEILSNLAELDELTAAAQPPMERLPGVRLALTRASRARTMLLEQIYPQLVQRAAPDQRAGIEGLKADGKDNMVTSAQHIGSWNLREITRRWPEYCAASNVLRAAMRKRIALEAKLIYPLLD